MSELKICPCGKIPRNLLINGLDYSKWAYVSGDCCGIWEVEYRNNYHKLDSTEAMEAAKTEWNNADRANSLLKND